MRNLWQRVVGRYERTIANVIARRPLNFELTRPIVSFTFDDFPRSALHAGGAILEDFGARGTYFASVGLMAKKAPTGEIFHQEDLPDLLDRGHELGCHTYHHYHSFHTDPAEFENSVLENGRAIRALVPGMVFQTLSYPLSLPHPEIKRRCAKHFAACRGGGQVANVSTVDLNSLRAFFIEQAHEDRAALTEAINKTVRVNGWLIFATHDIAEHPTRYGCRPGLFRYLVEHAQRSGCLILTVAEALEKLAPSHAIATAARTGASITQ